MSDTPTPRTDAVRFRETWINRTYEFVSADEMRKLERELQQKDAQIESVVEERDQAEEAIGEAYNLVIGNAPEWSNHFGYTEALTEIEQIVTQKDAQIAALRGALSGVLEITTPMTPSIDSIIETGEEAEELWKIHLICHYAALSSPPPAVVSSAQYDELKAAFLQASKLLEKVVTERDQAEEVLHELKADAEELAYTLGLLGAYSSFREENKKSDANVREVACDALNKFRTKHPQKEDA